MILQLALLKSGAVSGGGRMARSEAWMSRMIASWSLVPGNVSRQDCGVGKSPIKIRYQDWSTRKDLIVDGLSDQKADWDVEEIE